MKRRKISYSQKYRKEWESDVQLKDWIEDIPADKTAVLCKYCRCVLKAHHALLLEHAKTSKHVKAAQPFSCQRQVKLKFDQASTYSPEKAAAEVKLTLFITCHCAIRCIDHLSELFKLLVKDVNNIKDIKLHRSKSTAILKNIIAPHFKNDLRRDIGDGFYSLLIDESTDIAVLKQLGICIIYFSMSKKTIVSTFLKLQSLEAGNAQSIVIAVKTVLAEYNLPIQKMRGLGTDNASVMIGINNGVYRKLKEEIPHLILIRCVCHSIQLAISSAVTDTLPRNLEFLISETYNWFSRSTERREQYKLLFKALNDGLDPLKIVQLAPTRWLSIAEAVRRILRQWLELKTHFQLRRTADKCYAAELLYNMYSDIRNELYFIFLEPLLNETQSVNKAFQTNNGDPAKLLKDLTILIQGIVQRIVITRCKENLLKINVRHYLHPNPYLGYNFEEKVKEFRKNNSLTMEDERSIRTRCIDFMIALIDQLQQRLPDNVEILSNISLLSPEKCLSTIKQSVIHLAQFMAESEDAITKIDFQWSKLSFVQWRNIESTISFWREVQEYRDTSGENPFNKLVNLALKCLVLPWSNSDVERAFSQMKIVKTPSRNRLQQDMINAILMTRAGLRRNDKCCLNYEFPSSVLRQTGTMAAYNKENESCVNLYNPNVDISRTNSILNDDMEFLFDVNVDL